MHPAPGVPRLVRSKRNTCGEEEDQGTGKGERCAGHPHLRTKVAEHVSRLQKEGAPTTRRHRFGYSPRPRAPCST
jgi:hypothetical protein